MILLRNGDIGAQDFPINLGGNAQLVQVEKVIMDHQLDILRRRLNPAGKIIIVSIAHFHYLVIPYKFCPAFDLAIISFIPGKTDTIGIYTDAIILTNNPFTWILFATGGNQ